MLIIFLGLATVLLVYLVKLAQNIKEISEKAKELINDASSVASTMKKAAAPTVVAKFVADQISSAVKRHSKEKER